MKDRKIVHAHQQAGIYKEYYRPSMNPWRFVKSILGVLVFGNSTVARSYIPRKEKY
jgi:hypothetical protein